MTIAVGILATDGVVLAADTEETSGYLKTGQSKILGVLQAGSATPYVPKGVCSITGAGDGDYLDTISAKLADVFLDHPSALGKDLQNEFGHVIDGFYTKHVLPFAVLPPADYPDFSLVIGYERGGFRDLLTTSKTTTRRSVPYVAVGGGHVLAKIFLDRLWTVGLDVETTVLLAAYVVFHAKESVEGCGKFTQIDCIKNNSFLHVDAAKLERLDRLFRKQGHLEKALMYYLFGAVQPQPKASPLKQLNSLTKQLEREFKALLPIVSSY